MNKSVDLIVIGVGMAAVSAANKCAAAGWTVAVIDELPYGGTCALCGCDPKKMLQRGAEIVDAARLMQGKGISDGGLKIDWSELVAFKRTFTESMPGRIEAGFTRNGIDMFHGAESTTQSGHRRARPFEAKKWNSLKEFGVKPICF